MFVDEDLDPVEFKSSWKKERSLKDSSSQTKPLPTSEVAVQSLKRKTKETQTDDDRDTDFIEEETPELSEFLAKVAPRMFQELTKAQRSHAFDGYDTYKEEETDTVTCLHTLQHRALNEELQVTGLSWNSTGSVIAAAYGRLDHEDWCTHRSALCTWNPDRRNMDANKPDTVIDIPTCLMCIACHPVNPSWIVGGTFNGEVMLWDLSREDDMLIATSGIGDDSHREPVSKVQWIKDPGSKGKKYQIVSVGGDGKILVWSLFLHQRALRLADGFILLTESLPQLLRVKAKRGDQEMGVTCISYSSLDNTQFLIGSESGGIFRCSTQSRGAAASSTVMSSVPLHSPVTFTFGPHHGPVYSVDYSPFHRNLFLSCGCDSSARLYSVLQTQPVITLEPDVGYLYSARWSPVRPLVFAVASAAGTLLIYDLKHSRGAPKYRLDCSPKKQPIYTMQFNPNQHSLLATGDGSGVIQIWKLNDDLTNEHGQEMDILDDISNSALE